MSALAVEAPAAPEWSGRLVVRAAGRPVLHVAAEGATAPAVPMFTVPLECVPDAEQAPGVRPWDGPVTAANVCPACLRALRSEPEPEAPRIVPTGVAEGLPEPAPDDRGRHLRAVPDLTVYAEALRSLVSGAFNIVARTAKALGPRSRGVPPSGARSDEVTEPGGQPGPPSCPGPRPDRRRGACQQTAHSHCPVPPTARS
ncbi:hypothetical protein ACFT38_28410 [Streptomyces sp. NPDC056975]|uniref:hypothetical protein n=1 Tax=Streptomyces sp. NPDC056975 TaxID=3345985 RepID=UPI00363BF095